MGANTHLRRAVCELGAKSGPMKITKDTVVNLHYKLSDPSGKALEQSQQPVAYLHGGYDGILPRIEQALEGQEAGFKTSLLLQPEDAFGQRDESLARTISKSDFPPGVKVGGQLKGLGDDGSEQVFTVMKIKGDTVYLDANHPLAGRALRFAIEVTGVRLASGEEITHQHAHGEHGHHH
jgi:FKBP-type peptidyl-prolyl cis-trans isomerase SlyD